MIIKWFFVFFKSEMMKEEENFSRPPSFMFDISDCYLTTNFRPFWM